MTEQSKGIRFLTAEEVAARLSKSKSWVWNKTNPKSESYDPMSAPRHKVYNGTRFIESEVEQWFAYLISNGREKQVSDDAIDTGRAVRKHLISDADFAPSEPQEKSGAAKKTRDARSTATNGAKNAGTKTSNAIEKPIVDSRGKRFTDQLGKTFGQAVRGGRLAVNQALGKEDPPEFEKVLKRMVKISTVK